MILNKPPDKSLKVFIAAKYSEGDDTESIIEHTEEVVKVSIELMRKGHTPLSSHLLFPNFGDIFSSETIISHAMKILLDCDAIYFMPSLKKSGIRHYLHECADHNGINEIYDIKKFLGE